VAEYQQLLDPQRRISAGVSVLTGITQEMVQGQPQFCDVLPAICDLLRDAVVVGHNVRFDLSFLHKEFRRGGCALGEAVRASHVIDTVRLARRRFGRGGNGLQTLARTLDLNPSAAHRGLADAHTTARLLERLLEPCGGWAAPLCDVFAAQGGAMGLEPPGPRQSLLPLELEESLETRCDVRIEYLDAQDQRSHRTVQPLQVRRVSGELVLVAHCRLRDARRNFKLDRIVQIECLSVPAPIPA
jgi:DNA polymerase III epsilon subunit-like protein